jgi:hypothetical protein
MLIHATPEMLAFLDERRSPLPFVPPPVSPPPVATPAIAPAEMRAIVDKARTREAALSAAPERRSGRPPALPLKGTLYGMPKRKKR